MRQALHNVGTPDHVALAYDAWAPVEDNDGKVRSEKRSQENDSPRDAWFKKLESVQVHADYEHAFKRWKASFSATGDRLAELTLTSRLLIGHGNASAIDVGLTVHHTWGVPVIPGSALKGLVAHYVDATYGPTDSDKKPWEQQGDELVRADYQGVTWNGRRIERGPGAIYRALFGAPDAREDATMRDHGFETGAAAGLVTFHDALYVPGSISDNKPFAPDVLTVHQKGYYDSSGQNAPNDYGSPNPVAFLTVQPRVRLLFALSGPADWTELAERLLHDALESWGVGGKTSAGYGRLTVREQSVPSARSIAVAMTQTVQKPGDRVEATLLEERTKKGGWKAHHKPSGLSGPIQNHADVPADKEVGDVLTLIVAIANQREIAFRYPSSADEAQAQGRRNDGRDTGRRRR